MISADCTLSLSPSMLVLPVRAKAKLPPVKTSESGRYGKVYFAEQRVAAVEHWHDMSVTANGDVVPTTSLTVRVMLKRVKGATRGLRQPVAIKIRREDGLFFAENKTLSICGVGSTMEEAKGVFERHLLHFWKYYRALPQTKVMGNAAQLKKVFSTIFED